MSSNKSGYAEEPSIISLLKEDHKKSLGLLTSLCSPKAGVRKGWLFLEVQREVEIHALVEEQTLYPKLAEREETLGLVRQARQEHTVMRMLLDRLEDLAVEDPAFLATAHELKDLVERHIYDEENEVFAQLQTSLTKDELAQLARDFMEIRENLLAPSEAA